MNPILKSVLIFIAGIVVGSIVNMGIIMLGSSLIPPPAGVDVTDIESIKAAMPSFEPRHFISPFLAHALGTLVGAYVVARFSDSNQRNWALGIGVFFLLGGITNAFALPAPTWFVILDLAGAYIPMAMLAVYLAGKNE